MVLWFYPTKYNSFEINILFEIKLYFSCQNVMMLKLFKENIRIALGSTRTQLLQRFLRWWLSLLNHALVSILTVVSALEKKYDLLRFCIDVVKTFNPKQHENTVRRQEGRKRNN
jgi:putative ABC transport system permease protein